MLTIIENSPVEMLRQLAVLLQADMKEHFNAAGLQFDNDFGSGTINLFEIFPGLSSWSFTLRTVRDLHIEVQHSVNRPSYFGFNVKGHQFQKFSKEKKFHKINQGENFILIGDPNSSSEFMIPKNSDFQCCYIIVDAVQVQEHQSKNRRWLQTQIKEVFSDTVKSSPYRFLGNIDLDTGLHANIILKNKRTDIVGRLIVEGAIMNMLASQLLAHDRESEVNIVESNLTKAELAKLTQIGDYIKSHLTDNLTVGKLSSHLAMSPKKVQNGIRYLFGYSANNFILNFRMEKAKELIHTTEMSISEICYMTGYASRSYFSKVFFDKFGILPNDYKKSFNENGLLYEVSYRSISTKSFNEQELNNIISTARAQNPLFQISGCLIYHENVFFQLIEGPKAHILQLVDNIKKDKRHEDFTILWKGHKATRDFDSWSMALLSDKYIVEKNIDGETRQLDLGPVMGNLQNASVASEKLWNKVRNILKAGNRIK